jgi:hypothetical protein
MRTIVLAAFLASAVTAMGNGGGYVYGTASNGALGLFQPKNAQQIEMQTEDLQIDLHLEFGRVRVEYTLHNPGKAITAEIGFPAKAAADLNTDENGKIQEDQITDTRHSMISPQNLMASASNSASPATQPNQRTYLPPTFAAKPVPSATSPIGTRSNSTSPLANRESSSSPMTPVTTPTLAPFRTTQRQPPKL